MEPNINYLGHTEITDEIARARMGAGFGDKLFSCAVRINGDKWINMTVLSCHLMADSLIDWQSILKQNTIRQAKAAYMERIRT